MFGFLKKIVGDPAAINDYFCDAVLLYALDENHSAGIAALTAAKVAAGAQRDSMVTYASSVAGDIQGSDAQAAAQILNLCALINEKDWNMKDIVEAKSKLRSTDASMAIALDKSDGQYFRKNFPKFFADTDGLHI